MQENHKILVVDDDARLRALLERYLSEQGFQVRSVANGEQMDRLLTRENFHLMVLDLMLPGEDGLSICRRLRHANNMLPILMLTAKVTRLTVLLVWKLVRTITYLNRSTRVNYSLVLKRFYVAKRLSYRAPSTEEKWSSLASFV